MNDSLPQLSSAPLIALAAALLLPLLGHAREPEPAFTFAAVDLENCGAFCEDRSAKVSEDNLRFVLGFRERFSPWRPGALAGEHQKHLQGGGEKETPVLGYRLAFREPVTVGSLIGGKSEIWSLKPDATYPGDPGDETQWQRVPVRRYRGSAALTVFPPRFQTRALMFVDRRGGTRSQLQQAWFYRARLHSETPAAVTNAKSEWTLYPGAAPPRTYAAKDVARGGTWINAGKNKEGHNTSPPITELNPTWFSLSWQEPTRVEALFLASNATSIHLYEYVGPPGLNPVTAGREDWRRKRDFETVQRSIGRATFLWLILPEPLETRGLKLEIRGVRGDDPQVVTISALHALRDLQQQPIPEPPQFTADQAPFPIPYDLPSDGYVTIAIDDARGQRVRNLVANTWREAGPGSEGWDLMDLRGLVVGPGEYRYTVLHHPPLTLRYETTAYPNVTTHFPERAAWMTDTAGPHGWMADHSPPKQVAIHGDRVYLGSPVAESGVSLIECDLEGRRLWALHSFAAFTGIHHMAVDEDYLYNAAPAKNAVKYVGGDPNSEFIWQVNRETHEVSTLGRIPPTGNRLRGIKSMAARDGKLYLTINAKQPWLSNAAKAGDVDVKACTPRYPPPREPIRPYEVVPDPRKDFLRLFRLTGRPPGYGRDHGLTWLESPKGPGGKQHVVLAFNSSVILGSAVFPVPLKQDYRVKLSVLKAAAPWPPQPDTEDHWQEVAKDFKLGWDCVPFPKGCRSRAVRITFFKGEDDIFADLMDGGGDADPMGVGGDGGGLDLGGGAWQGRLEGMKLLRRRYVNHFGSAKVRVTSGEVTPGGFWQARRTEPVSATNPGIMLLEWEQPKQLRGLAIKEIDGEHTVIEAWNGPANQPIPLRGGEHWEELATYEQLRRDLHSGFTSAFPTARYLDGYVDFGRTVETRALRLRVVKQWTDFTDPTDYRGRPDFGYRVDLGGKELDAKRCAIWGVAPLEYLGGEVPVDPLIDQRLEVFHRDTKKVEQEFPLPDGGALAFAPDGRLYGLSAGRVLRLNLEGGPHEVVVDDLQLPQALAIDGQGQLFVYDAAPDRQVIRVYDATGKYRRTIGKPGGYQAGLWDPLRLNQVVDIGIDRNDSLWVVDATYYPKRIAQFKTDGTWVKDLYGPTRYGGNGCLDPWDKSKLFLGPCEFAIDWETGKVRLRGLTTIGPHAGERPILVDGRRYLVTRPQFATQSVGAVHLYDGEKSRVVAAMGQADQCKFLNQPALLAALGNPPLGQRDFLWVDRSGDSQVQANEVELLPRGGPLTNFNRDLSIRAGTRLFAVAGFDQRGTPLYELREAATPGTVLTMDDGGVYRFADNGFQANAGYDAEGEQTWYLKTGGHGVHGLFKAGPYEDGEVLAQFGFIGHETAHAGELGEFVVIHSNIGAWSIMTRDGLYAGDILHNYRRGDARWWRFEEHDRGMEPGRLTAGQEHFSGYFTRSFADDKYYIVAGHNHASVLEVQGLESFRRFTGTVAVTGDDIRRLQAWQRQREQRAVFERAAVLDAYRAERPPKIDGSDDDWTNLGSAATIVEGEREYGRFRLAYDREYLYLFWRGQALGPLENGGDQWDRLFKTGGAVDLHLGLDPDAPLERKAPVAGDLRLLMTCRDGEPIAVLYRAVVPGTPADQAWIVHSPVTEVKFDVVRRIEDLVARRQVDDRGNYAFEARVPLAELDFTPEPGQRLKFDWGFLITDQEAGGVNRRLYWSNKATNILADAPSEARLQPDLWGILRLHDLRESKLSTGTLTEPTDTPPGIGDDFLEELKDDLK